jgi:hypothetical protein
MLCPAYSSSLVTIHHYLVQSIHFEAPYQARFTSVLALRHEDVWGRRYIDPYFLDLGTSWRFDELHAPAALPSGKQPPVTTG